MRFWFGPRIRHPFFPGLQATPVAEAHAIHPALYGTFEQLVQAADRGACAKRAVFVIHREDEPLLGDAQREVLWRRFRVPMFALVLDSKERLVAFECEAQNGLHVTSLDGSDTSLCDCGRPGLKVCSTASAA